MTPTGPRSRTEARRGGRTAGRGGRGAVPARCLWALVFGLLLARPAAALDLLTFWRLPECPLDLRAGGWTDYHVLTIAGGRRDEANWRLQVAAAGEDGWTLEVLPLAEVDGRLAPVAGEGWRIELDRGAAARRGRLADHVRRVVQWENGRPRELPPARWRDDPLVASSLQDDLSPDRREEQGPTTRVVGEAELLCRQYALTAVDTTRVALPSGYLLQVHRREIAVAVHDTIPLLGVAYAAEREESVSSFDPPRRRNPPPVRRVEVMELVGFGRDARPRLTGD